MPKIMFEAVLEYAKVFDQEGKSGDIDRGDAKSSQKWLRELAKNPHAVVNCYFTKQEDIDRILNHENFDNKVVNPQTGAESTRIKAGRAEFGLGQYLQLKRKLTDQVEFIDRKTGELVVVDKGGAPEVKLVEFVDGAIESTNYDYDENGPIGNGTKALVVFELYGKGATRLEKIGVTDLVHYEQNGEGGNGGFGF